MHEKNQKGRKYKDDDIVTDLRFNESSQFISDQQRVNSGPVDAHIKPSSFKMASQIVGNYPFTLQ